MDYFDQNNYLKNLFDINKQVIGLNAFNSVIVNQDFSSSNNCDYFNSFPQNNYESDLEEELFSKKEDSDFDENNNFK